MKTHLEVCACAEEDGCWTEDEDCTTAAAEVDVCCCSD